MEQVNLENSPSQTLVPRIKVILQLSSDLIGIFDDMIHESNFKPELTPHRPWIEDAKSNIQEYRAGLLKAALDADVSKVSLWANQLFNSYKYISDAPVPSRSQTRMLGAAGEINDVSRSIDLDIDTFDPRNVAAMAAALRDFKE